MILAEKFGHGADAAVGELVRLVEHELASYGGVRDVEDGLREHLHIVHAVGAVRLSPLQELLMSALSDVQGVSRHGERGGAGVPRGFLLEELGKPGDVVREFSRCGIQKRLREGRVGVRRAGDDDATRGRSAAPCGCAARRERRLRAERHVWGPECARRAG